MKTYRRLLTTLMLAVLLFSHPSQAQEDIAGTWQGTLQVAPDTALKIQFVITRDDESGAYQAAINSPDNPAIKNLPADGVELNGNKLSLNVAALSGSYLGTLENGQIKGTWSQPGSDLPLTLTPFVRSELSAADKEKLTGEWFGKLKIPNGPEFTILFKFETDAEGKFTGALANADAGGEWVPLADIAVADGDLEFRVPAAQATYSAPLDGEKLVGTLSQGTNKMELNVEKGTYVPPAANISLTDIAKEQLSGEWFGELDSPRGKVVLVLNFATNAGGQFMGEAKFPDMSPNAMPVKDMEFNEGKLLLTIPAAGVEYNATLSGGKIEGAWKQGGAETPLNLQKGEYVPKSRALELSDAAMQSLKGSWRGKVGPLTLVLRFETNAQGEHLGFLDSPDQGASGIKVSSATLADNKLDLRVTIGAEFSGVLSGNQITGEWRQGGQNQPLSFTKD